MKTHFQITFPQEPGASFPVAASNGRTLPIRARSDVRPTNFPTRLLTREEWDDLRRPAGPYQAAYQPKRPVPDVDFEAEDGTLHKTAEACLAHELKARFGVDTLDELQTRLNAPSESDRAIEATIRGGEKVMAEIWANDAEYQAQLPELPAPTTATQDEAVRLLTSALSRRGLKPAEAAKATGLTSQECRAVVAANPDTFRENAGKLFLVS